MLIPNLYFPIIDNAKPTTREDEVTVMPKIVC